MQPWRPLTGTRQRRWWCKALVGVLLLTTAGWIAPTPVGAHGDGHTCSNSSPSPSGWQCVRSVLREMDGNIDLDARRISYYYNGTRRGVAQMNMYFPNDDIHSVWICDSQRGDNIVPKIRVESVIGTIREFSAPGDAGTCREYPGSGINMQANRYRGLTRTPTGSAQHGTIWYVALPH
jgi:hypothetical protein